MLYGNLIYPADPCPVPSSRLSLLSPLPLLLLPLLLLSCSTTISSAVFIAINSGGGGGCCLALLLLMILFLRSAGICFAVWIGPSVCNLTEAQATLQSKSAAAILSVLSLSLSTNICFM